MARGRRRALDHQPTQAVVEPETRRYRLTAGRRRQATHEGPITWSTLDPALRWRTGAIATAGGYFAYRVQWRAGRGGAGPSQLPTYSRLQTVWSGALYERTWWGKVYSHQHLVTLARVLSKELAEQAAGTGGGAR